MTGNNILNYDYYSNTRMFIVIIPKIGGTLSILCSEFVAQDILKLPKRRVKMTNRVIFALSISDNIFLTNCHFFRTWLVPQGLVYGYSQNQGTCTSQGLLGMFQVGWIFSKTLHLHLHISCKSVMNGVKRSSEGTRFSPFSPQLFLV